MFNYLLQICMIFIFKFLVLFWRRFLGFGDVSGDKMRIMPFQGIQEVVSRGCRILSRCRPYMTLHFRERGSPWNYYELCIRYEGEGVENRPENATSLMDGSQGSPRIISEQFEDASMRFKVYQRAFREVTRRFKAFLGITGSFREFQGGLEVIYKGLREIFGSFQEILERAWILPDNPWNAWKPPETN